MRLKIFIFSFALLVSGVSQADTIAINGIDRDGFGGVYEVAGTGFDGGSYWWMCIEPNGSTSAGSGQGFLADAVSFYDGWDQQNTERLDFYTNNPGYYLSALPTQVKVMEYVLDTYLPWNTLAGPSGRFAEQDPTSSLYGNDDPFYNAFFAVQNFLSESYGKTTKSDFTDMSDFTFFAGNATDPGAIAARSALFSSILADVETKAAASFFDTYTAEHGYMIANTLMPSADIDNWQDALLIYSFAPVPEPSGALLIACTGLAIMLRRFRRVAA